MFSRTKTLKESFQNFQYLIRNTYETEEARSISQLVFKEILGYDTIKLILNENELIPASLFEQLDQIAHQLNQNKPIQYILGYEEFMGMKFIVNPSVLIPRPETENLVQWIIDDSLPENSVTIIDIGTGSGCIAVSLKKNRMNADVYALDVSKAALQVAEKNAHNNNVEVSFINEDILSYELTSSFDIIVSNPPYVLESEKDLMHKNVLDYEPSTALFVEDSDPLLFYRRIVQLAEKKLNPSGALYFEINESYSIECLELFSSSRWESVVLKNDLRDKPRMIKGVLK